MDLLKFFLLEGNCFVMLCWSLLYHNVNQLCVYIYPLSLEPPSRGFYSNSVVLSRWILTTRQREVKVILPSYSAAELGFQPQPPDVLFVPHGLWSTGMEFSFPQGWPWPGLEDDEV